MPRNDFKIFQANRIGLDQMYTDAMTYIKNVYNANGQKFTNASPFAQIVNVVVNLGRMILFYIETTVTELNILTAYQERSIKGLSELTGHVPSLGVAARGTLYMTYNKSGEYDGETIMLNNYTKIKNTSNGLTYIAVLPTNTMQITVGASDNKIELPIIQGEINYQQGTGTGEVLQSFNFANKTDNVVDNYFINVYVNGVRWKSVDSILDMTYEQQACVVKPSINGGIDVFFGTGNNGAVPVVGSTILFEYIVTSGYAGNVDTYSDENYWEFDDYAFDMNGDYVNLNGLYNLTSASDIIFGGQGESIEMTRKLAPHMSRSFVLANDVNYKTFLSKLNIFSVVDAFSGFRTSNDKQIEEEYFKAKADYNVLRQNYAAQINISGVNSATSENLYEQLNNAKKNLDALEIKYNESKMDDNVIYLYLVPDISKRLGTDKNYFTCPLSYFSLTDDEKNGVLNLIEDSGQRMITTDNRIIDPVYAKFSINIFIQMWNDYNFNSVKSSIISALSDYLINNTRRDRIPLSDIVKVVEGVDGVDSVTAYFDADEKNSIYFGEGKYGIDDFGDIVLSRPLTDTLGNKVDVHDIQALFRGDFTSPNGVYYNDGLNALLGSLNVTLRGKTAKNRI